MKKGGSVNKGNNLDPRGGEKITGEAEKWTSPSVKKKSLFAAPRGKSWALKVTNRGK